MVQPLSHRLSLKILVKIFITHYKLFINPSQLLLVAHFHFSEIYGGLRLRVSQGFALGFLSEEVLKKLMEFTNFKLFTLFLPVQEFHFLLLLLFSCFLLYFSFDFYSMDYLEPNVDFNP